MNFPCHPTAPVVALGESHNISSCGHLQCQVPRRDVRGRELRREEERVGPCETSAESKGSPRSRRAG